MNLIKNTISPSATEMIRMDHTHVIGLFHRFKFDDDPETKQANVTKNCLAIEIHAQLEEEFFYPALRRTLGDNAVLRKSVPEHDELRHLIGQLRAMDPSDAGYDETYMHLLRNVLHHVADEESVLLSEAEHRMPEQLHEIGAQMTRRRVQLMARHAGQYVSDRVREQPGKSMLIAAGAVLAGTVLARRTFAHNGRDRSSGRGGMRDENLKSERASFKLGRMLGKGESRLAEQHGMMDDSMKSERASFKLGRKLGKGEGMGRGFLWRKRAGSALESRA